MQMRIISREYEEGFTVMGDKMSFEWNFEEEDPYIYKFTDATEQTTIGAKGKNRKMCGKAEDTKVSIPI